MKSEEQMDSKAKADFVDVSGPGFDIYRDHAVSVIHIKGPILALATDLTHKEQFFGAIVRASLSPSIRVLLFVSDRNALGEDEYAEFAQSVANDPDAWMLLSREDHALSQFARLVYSTEKLVVAGVHGSVIGPFLGAILAADFRIATEGTTFSFPHIPYETPPPAALAHFLPQYVGTGRAWQMMMNGKLIMGQAAFEMGLVDEIVPDELLLSECIEKAKALTIISPRSVALAKKSRKIELQGLDQRCETESLLRRITWPPHQIEPSRGLHS
jgi:enoyl-CoA hydratase/carnithine racemase